jgi:hypothetical protein
MKNGLLILAAVGLMLVATPAAFAQEQVWPTGFLSNGEYAIGLGAGFSNKDVSRYIVAGRYWGASWELGAEAFTVFQKESDRYDQLFQSWLAYRYNLNISKGAGRYLTYVGIGAGGIFKENQTFDNSVGPVGLVGWDSDLWGVQAKAAWYSPTLFSIVVYYNGLPD